MTDEFDDNPPVEMPRLPGQGLFFLRLMGAKIEIREVDGVRMFIALFRHNVEMPMETIRLGQQNVVFAEAHKTMDAFATLIKYPN